MIATCVTRSEAAASCLFFTRMMTLTPDSSSALWPAAKRFIVWSGDDAAPMNSHSLADLTTVMNFLVSIKRSRSGQRVRVGSIGCVDAGDAVGAELDAVASSGTPRVKSDGD